MNALHTRPPTLAEIETIARDAFRDIPDILRARAEDVVVRVVDFPDRDIERDLDLESPFEILGLYKGVPFGEKSVSDVPQDIDIIYLYRRPLLDYWCETEEDLTGLVRHVLIHEIGHHFGFTDEQMEEIEEMADRAAREG